jgi:hypothetical protein
VFQLTLCLLHRYSPTLGDAAAAATAAGSVQWQLEQDFQASRVASGGGSGYDSEDDEVAADMHMLLWPQEVPSATATAGATARFTAATTVSHSSWRPQEEEGVYTDVPQPASAARSWRFTPSPSEQPEHSRHHHQQQQVERDEKRQAERQAVSGARPVSVPLVVATPQVIAKLRRQIAEAVRCADSRTRVLYYAFAIIDQVKTDPGS